MRRGRWAVIVVVFTLVMGGCSVSNKDFTSEELDQLCGQAVDYMHGRYGVDFENCRINVYSGLFGDPSYRITMSCLAVSPHTWVSLSATKSRRGPVFFGDSFLAAKFGHEAEVKAVPVVAQRFGSFLVVGSVGAPVVPEDFGSATSETQFYSWLRDENDKVKTEAGSASLEYEADLSVIAVDDGSGVGDVGQLAADIGAATGLGLNADFGVPLCVEVATYSAEGFEQLRAYYAQMAIQDLPVPHPTRVGLELVEI